MDIKAFLKSSPTCAGVYLMKDDKSRLLYVGKAANLKKRLSSYFYNPARLESRIAIMLKQVAKIDFKLCSSETEALILEAELIKKLRPKYNTLGRDDKSFPWAKITNEDFPIVSVARPKLQDNALLIGPFTSAELLKTALKAMRRIFPYRTCARLPKKPCLNYYLQLCPAVCANKITKLKYRENLHHLRQVLEGEQKTSIKELTLKMQRLSRVQNFEEAALIRDQIQALERLWQEKPQEGFSGVLWQLKSSLGLRRLPLRIEGFDVSNIAGDQNVGSLVSFYKAQPDKDNYRRFRIKTVKGANDYQSILEILKRRFEKKNKDNLDLPDLVIVDGGKPQVSAVKKALEEVDVDIDVIGLAKKREYIYLADNCEPVILPRYSKALQLVEQVRNEAHRFALKYHRLLRKKKMLER